MRHITIGDIMAIVGVLALTAMVIQGTFNIATTAK